MELQQLLWFIKVKIAILDLLLPPMVLLYGLKVSGQNQMGGGEVKRAEVDWGGVKVGRGK